MIGVGKWDSFRPLERKYVSLSLARHESPFSGKTPRKEEKGRPENLKRARYHYRNNVRQREVRMVGGPGTLLSAGMIKNKGIRIR